MSAAARAASVDPYTKDKRVRHFLKQNDVSIAEPFRLNLERKQGLGLFWMKSTGCASLVFIHIPAVPLQPHAGIKLPVLLFQHRRVSEQARR